jgi:hypothetical protein
MATSMIPVPCSLYRVICRSSVRPGILSKRRSAISCTESQGIILSRTARKTSLSLTQTVSFEVMKIGSARRIVVSSISWRVRILSPLDMEVMCTPAFSRLPSNTGVRESVAVMMISASSMASAALETARASIPPSYSTREDSALDQADGDVCLRSAFIAAAVIGSKGIRERKVSKS